MCLIQSTEVSIEQVNAFKAFSMTNDGKLQSVFNQARKPNLYYEPNKRTRVDNESESFFAFKEEKDVKFFVNSQKRSLGHGLRWDLSPGTVIYCPVTLYEITKKGLFEIPDDDPQTLDYYCDVFEAKEIVVHYSEQILNEFYRKTVKSFIKKNLISATGTEQKAIKEILSEFT